MTSFDEFLAEQVRDIIRKECREQLDTAFRAGNHVSLAALDEKLDDVAQRVHTLSHVSSVSQTDIITVKATVNNHADALVELQNIVVGLANNPPACPAEESGSVAEAEYYPVGGGHTTGAGFSIREVKVLPGYECLFDVLVAALEQAQSGKGAERHANELPFSKQPMQTVADATGSIDGILFQMMKKARESNGMPLDRAVRELLGSIVYAAGAVIWRQRHGADEQS